jgi:hypothetical protein
MARVLWDPSEAAYTDETIATNNGWTSSSVNFLTSIGPNPRKDPSGNGGLILIRGYTSFNARDALRSPALDTPLNHYFIHIAAACQGSGTVNRIEARNSGGSMILRLSANGSTSLWTLSDASGTLATTSKTPGANTWNHIVIEAYHDAVSGFVKVWIDNVLEVDYTGATTAGPATYFAINGDDDPYWDDWCVDSITLRYDGGGGTFAPVAGDDITDGTTGAVATITAVDGDATSGVLTLENWNSTAFGNNNTITEDGTSTTAAVDAPNSDFLSGFEPNSTKPANEYILAVYPDGAGSFSQLRSVNSVDGSQATGTLTSTATPSDGDTVTIGSQTYTYKTTLSTGPTVPDEVLIGASQALAMENLRRAINGDGVEGTDYSTGTSTNADVTASDTATTVVATSIFYGTSENSIATTETGANLSWGNATLTGGTGVNYEAVDDLLINAATYNQASAAGDKDTYTHDVVSRLSSTTSRITAVASFAYARSSGGGIDGGQLVLYDGSTEYTSPRETLSLSSGTVQYTWVTRPDNDEGWTLSSLSSVFTEIGIKFVV